jgi:hypothetical protein
MNPMPDEGCAGQQDSTKILQGRKPAQAFAFL